MLQRLFVHGFVTNRLATPAMKEQMWKLHVLQFQQFMCVGCCVWFRMGLVQRPERDRQT